LCIASRLFQRSMAAEFKAPVKTTSLCSCKCTLVICAGIFIALTILGSIATNAVVISQLVELKNARATDEVVGPPEELRIQIVQGMSKIASVAIETNTGDVVDCINAGVEYHPEFTAMERNDRGIFEEVRVMSMAIRCQSGDVLIYPPNSTETILARDANDGGDGTGDITKNGSHRQLWAAVAYYGYRYGVPATVFVVKRYSGALGANNFRNDITHVRNTFNGNYYRRARASYSQVNNWIYTRYR